MTNQKFHELLMGTYELSKELNDLCGRFSISSGAYVSRAAMKTHRLMRSRLKKVHEELKKRRN